MPKYSNVYVWSRYCLTLLLGWGFICSCDLCNKEAVENNVETYETYKNLKMQIEITTILTNPTIGNTKRQISCYKEMYKLAKEKNVPRSFIIHTILSPGFKAAIYGYKLATKSNKILMADDFRKECDIFFTAGVKLSKIVGISNWKKYHNFENSI